MFQDQEKSSRCDSIARKNLEKTHLNFGREERRSLRNELLKDWKYSKHYVDSAIDSIIGLVKSWIMLYNRGKAKRELEITKKSVYIKNTLFSFRNGILKISIEPHKRHLEVDLKKYEWIPKDFERIGGLILTEKELIITVKKGVEPKANSFASFDVNLTNVTALIDGKVKRYDLKQLYHIHRVYEMKRRRIQKLSKFKPKTAEELLRKYSCREKNRKIEQRISYTNSQHLLRESYIELEAELCLKTLETSKIEF